MLNSEQNDEECDATGLIVVMQLGPSFLLKLRTESEIKKTSR
jgi:hypothetical protein